MAVSCPEVMYGAYYPYLYGRGAARSFHHAPHFQYDRFNVQSGGEAYAAGVSSGSSGAQSPASPPHAHAHHARLRAKEEELSAHGRTSADAGGGSSESEGSPGGASGPSGTGAARSRAHYVSANCVVFTHYTDDVASAVDQHFTRALSLDRAKESGVPMVSRNLPASFFNAAAAPCAAVDLYDYDPWHQHYSGYGHAAHRHAAEYHAAAAAASHHNMAAAGYGGLLLGRSSLHAAQYKPVEWPQPHLDPAACSPYSYPPPPGLEAQVQDTSKDLYWF